MNALNYPAPILGTVLSHFPAAQPLVRDGYHAGSKPGHSGSSDDAEHLMADVRIRSGDYFITLATELDKLAQTLSATQAPEAFEVELLVSELMYIHQNYRMVRK